MSTFGITTAPSTARPSCPRHPPSLALLLHPLEQERPSPTPLNFPCLQSKPWPSDLIASAMPRQPGHGILGGATNLPGV